MEHVVFYPASDGAPAFRRLANLEEAVRLVEHLRNVEGVSSVSVHALTEVPLAFRTYYRVEVPGAVEPGPVAAAPVLGLAPEPEAPSVEPLQVAPALALAEPPPVSEPFRIDVPAQADALEQQAPAEEPVAEEMLTEDPGAEEPVVEEPVVEESDDSQPVFAIANGRGGPSLGFFA